MNIEELKRILSDAAEEAADAAASREMTLCEAQRTLAEVGEMIAAILDRLEGGSIISAAQEQAIREDFLAWTGGFPPDSDHEIFTYAEAAMPSSFDQTAARIVLKSWLTECSLPQPLISE